MVAQGKNACYAVIATIKTEQLLSYCDPFDHNVWGEKVSKEAVLQALRDDRLVCDYQDKTDPAGRIAYLVRHKAADPIEIDLGYPGCFNEWIISDGNHRFAAALLRGDPEILCHFSGLPEYIQSFLGHPESAD